MATALPFREVTEQVRRQERTPICGARRPGFQTWFSCSAWRGFLPALPLLKGTSYLNCPQLNSSVFPQRSITLSGNSTTLPKSPSQKPGSHQRRPLTLTAPHSQSVTVAQSVPLTAAPGQASPSSDAATTSSLSQIVQQLCQL